MYKCDVGDLADVRKLKEKISGNLPEGGHVEYVINNAAIVHGKLFMETDEARYSKVMQVNALGVMHVTKAFYAEMLEKGGHVTNIASIAGLGPAPRMVSFWTFKKMICRNLQK